MKLVVAAKSAADTVAAAEAVDGGTAAADDVPNGVSLCKMKLLTAGLNLFSQIVQIHEFGGHGADQVVERLQKIHQVAQISLQLIDAVLQFVVSVSNVTTAGIFVNLSVSVVVFAVFFLLVDSSIAVVVN